MRLQCNFEEATLSTGHINPGLPQPSQGEGASLANIVHWSIAVVEGHARWVGRVPHLLEGGETLVHVVAGLGPGFLVEIDAVAVV